MNRIYRWIIADAADYYHPGDGSDVFGHNADQGIERVIRRVRRVVDNEDLTDQEIDDYLRCNYL